MAARSFSGAVIDGGVRDVGYLQKIGFPVFALGIVPSTSVSHYRFAGTNIPVICDGVPVGLGSHVSWDRKLDGRLAAALMSIPAVKAVEIGLGVDCARRKGSEVHDEIDAVQDQIKVAVVGLDLRVLPRRHRVLDRARAETVSSGSAQAERRFKRPSGKRQRRRRRSARPAPIRSTVDQG